MDKPDRIEQVNQARKRMNHSCYEDKNYHREEWMLEGDLNKTKLDYFDWVIFCIESEKGDTE